MKQVPNEELLLTYLERGYFFIDRDRHKHLNTLKGEILGDRQCRLEPLSKTPTRRGVTSPGR